MTARGQLVWSAGDHLRRDGQAGRQEPADERMARLAADVRKSFLGSEADRWTDRRVRYRTETLKIWSATEPVRGISTPAIGPLWNRLYSFTMLSMEEEAGQEQR
jgi:hypothetical protein